MNKTKKRRFQFIALISGFVAMTLGVLFSSGRGLGSFISGLANRTAGDYSITLNSSNKVTVAGDHVQHTKRGSNVTFTYSNINSSTSGHTTLNDTGYLVNKVRITSIDTFKVVFSTTSDSVSLKLKASFDGSTWGEEWDAISNESYFLSSHPYFIQMTASGGRVEISSVDYTFSCTENPDATPTHHTTDEGWYLVTDASSLVGGDEVLIVGLSGSNYYALDNGTIRSDLWYYLSATSISVSNDGLTATKTSSHDVWTVGRVGEKFTFINGSNYLRGGVASSKYYNLALTTRSEGTMTNDWELINQSASGAVTLNTSSVYLEFAIHNNTQPEFKGNQNAPTSTYVFLFKYCPAESYDEYNTPVDAVGFTAVEPKVNEFTTNSVYANEKGLVVKALYSDGTEVPLSEGPDGYSYIVKNSFDVNIDPTEKFPEQGVYTVVVSYGNYIPLEITLYVGEYVYAVDITAAMEDTTFNTADVLGENLTGNLTATVEYSNGSRGDSIQYSGFAEAGLGVKLLSPRGFAHDFNTVFGLEGTWTVKVYDLTNEQLSYSIDISVAAIPVDTITLDETSYELNPNGTLQLHPSVGPVNATNTAIDWSSNNEAVATVDDTGLVTAHAVGGATITALAADGSNVFGTCSISVVAPVELTNDVLTKATTGVSGTTYTGWSGKGKNSSGVVSDAVYAGNSAGPNSNQTGPNSIQLRAKDNSGIVTTTSGGKIAKITVAWNSDTADGRTLNIYGKSTAYSGPSDLYLSNTTGELLGTIVNGTSTEFKVTGSYEYVGVRSNGSAMYLDSIIFSWSDSAGDPIIPEEKVYPTEISLSGNNSLTIGDTSQLEVAYTPSNTNVKNVTWSSSNSNIASVSTTGLVTAVAQGNATITATAEAENGTITATRTINVSPVAVTSVVLDQNSASVKAGRTITLVPTVYPNNATNKNVTWKSSNTSVATVSNAGVVTGVSGGTTTITVTTVDGSKTAQCVVTVTSSAAGYFEDVIDNGATLSDLGNLSTSTWGEFTITGSSGVSYHIRSMGTKNTSNALQWNTNGYLYSTSSEGTIYKVSAELPSGKSITVYGSNTAFSSNSGGTQLGSISGSGSITPSDSYDYIRIVGATSGTAITSITIEYGTPTPTNPTSIIMSPTSAELSPGGTKQLSVSYVPSNANQNKDITWTSSNTNVATVSSDGLVTVKSTATAGQKATITATLTNLTSISATCTVTVVAQQNDDHTVLIYICGADLESKNQLATGDIQEILKVSGQPDDVNIVIETGGASSWASTYGISSSKLERWHVENKSLVKDASLTYASMGLTSTLQSFIEYGLKNYPAERTGLVFWNHGGGMRGVCYDEKKDDDVLKNSEIRSALSGAFSNCGISGQKLEWVGYDACLMAVQDIAITNAEYFNYMIASEESEAGYGWDYDNWVDDLYSKKSTTTILKAIVDSFITDNGGVNKTSGDQTLSYMNLAYASAYKTAWENLAAQLNNKVTSSNKSSFNSAITSNVKHYADSDYDYFCTFDAYDFVTKLASDSAFSSFRVDSTYTSAVTAAFDQFVAYSVAQKGAGKSYGLCMYWPNSSQYSDVSTYYTTSETTLTTWRSFCVNKGTHT